jgi:hypothetical protein
MIYGIWNFSSAPIPTAHTRDLVTVCAATKLTGIFDEQPATPPAAPNYAAPSVQPAYSQVPPPFGCGKSAMIQLWELALNNNPNQQ